MSDASVTITGRITADPVLRHTESGLPVANFTVAHTERRQDDAGEWKDYGDTMFLRVTAWRDLGKNAAASLQKGDSVTVTGRLGVRMYTNELGVERMDVTCTAESVAVDLRWATAAIERNAREAAAIAPLRRAS